MLDANTAALEKYEARIEKQEQTYAMFITNIEPYVNQIRDAKADIQALADHYELDVDIDEVIAELI